MSLFFDQDDHTPYPSHTNMFSDSIPPPPSPTSSSAGTRTDVPPPNPQSYHLKFQPSESTDVTFKSSDNMYFSLHRRNLETHADAFPGPDIPVNQEEVIDLTESHDILAIIFDFMYPRKQADIEKMEFETVIQVAEAVEKYQVFAAMKVCEMRLKQLIPTHAAEILAHGVKHDYPSLVNGALPFLARRPLVEVLERLPPQYYIAFGRYHEAWNEAFRETIKAAVNRLSGNNQLSSVLIRIFEWEAIGNVSDLQRKLEKDAELLQPCQNCNRYNQNHYQQEIQRDIQQSAVACLQKIQEMNSFSVF